MGLMVATLLVVLAVAAAFLAVWRLVLRDVTGSVLALFAVAVCLILLSGVH